MFRLLAFLTQNRNLLLFLVLEGVAFALIVSFNDSQRHIFGDGMLETAGKIQQKRAGVAQYFSLDEYADQLAYQADSMGKELDSMRKRLEVLEALSTLDSTRKEFVPDSLSSHEQFVFMPCRAIKNTTDRNYNYITLDKGERHGITENMGLISPQGVAGKVIRVSKNFSLALSAINVSFKLQAKVERVTGQDNVGLYEWSGADPKFGFLNNIPLDIQLNVGDKVVTSGYSTVFPEGFPIGTISELERNTQAGYHVAKVKLATRFRSLGNMYLVKALHKEELETLEQDLNQ